MISQVMEPTTNVPNPPGLVIYVTETIRLFLSAAAKDPHLSQELREIALNLSSQDDVPYRYIRALWFATQPSERPDLLRLLHGTAFVFTRPKPREKSEELKARLKKLEDLAERKAYQELVKDITPRKDTDEPFSSYKDQLGFGIHVALIMFTGYLVGYAAFRALFNHSPAMNAAGGIIGLVGGMLVETFLFIIRTSDRDLRPTSSTSKLKKL
ncbi:ATPase, vacuolar ER assembly factor, Vma12 [Quillaja saponaria]|uniref:ATPase, vacuolar ER assembly factor, Vma12 n=1 Tax=Quillaja saponaria TaxID=32244 RepID=A0AAD7L906_QUISA|nr:ATPase, vacuolar ER assembly factor, Vma12 [Quillaja saponaria]